MLSNFTIHFFTGAWIKLVLTYHCVHKYPPYSDYRLAACKRARVAAGSTISIAILWPSDTALVSVRRRTGIGGNRIKATAAHDPVLSLYDPAIIDCVDNAITKKAVVPPAPS